MPDVTFQVDAKRCCVLSRKLCLLHNRFYHSTGTDAAGTYTNLLGAAANGSNPNLLQIGQPTTPGLVVGVADIVSGNWLFAAYFTLFRHNHTPLKIEKPAQQASRKGSK